jgi:hypothetical protein
MKNRFDLENEIMKLYVFVDNIEDAVEFLAKSDVDPKVIDAMSNILLGINTLMSLHAEKMLDTMNQCFKLDQYREDIKISDKDLPKRERMNASYWTDSLRPIYHADMSYDPDQ